VTVDQIVILYFCIGMGWAGFSMNSKFQSKDIVDGIQVWIDDFRKIASEKQVKALFITVALAVAVFYDMLLWPVSMIDSAVKYLKEKSKNDS